MQQMTCSDFRQSKAAPSSLDISAAGLEKARMRFAAVIVAAGAGRRFGGNVPKQWRDLAGKPVVRWSAEAFASAGAEIIVVVVSPGEEARAQASLVGLPQVELAPGGAERIDSVRQGLKAISATGVQAVLIHDAARPLLQRRHVADLLAALAESEGAVPALAVADTLKRGDGGRVLATVDRAGLFRAQTPQAFRLQPLLDAFAAWPQGETPTDDAAVLERAGAPSPSRPAIPCS